MKTRTIFEDETGNFLGEWSLMDWQAMELAVERPPLFLSGKRWEVMGTRSPVKLTDDPWSQVLVLEAFPEKAGFYVL